MPVKTFTFAFKMDAKDLLEYVMNRNLAIDIHATGTKRAVEPPVQPVVESTEQGVYGHLPLLPSPKDSEHNSREVVLLFMAQHPKEKFSVTSVRTVLEQTGFSPKMTSGLIHILYKSGYIKHSGKGFWRITTKGLRKAEEAE